jgi:secondary thiamine-phosphate synthase enzyme
MNGMSTRELSLDTGGEPSLTDLTGACAGFLRDVAAEDGLLTVFVPHATAGVVVVELGAGSEEDVLAALERLLPHDDRWRHRHGSPGHGADHVLPILVSPSLTVPVVAGRMTLGTWQSIALLDPNADNSRRTVQLGFLPG